MCGIVGAVGTPLNRFESYSLMTHLLRETRRRGPHATGFFAVDLENEVRTHKEGVCANTYVKTLEWKRNLRGFKALVGHARWKTHGSHTDNANNHPFTSQSGCHGLVHNGVISMYDTLKDKYKSTLEGECDSELILRIILKEKDVVRGIKKAFDMIGSAGDFACELIHRNPNTGKTMFYFFRDRGRPGKFIDARAELGQFFFCSEDAIWKDAVLKSGMGAKIRRLTPVEIPPYQIWCIDADTLEIKKIDVPHPPYRSPKYTYSSSTGMYGTRWTGHGTHNAWDDDYYTGRGYPYANTVSSANSKPTTRQVPITASSVDSVLKGDNRWTETTNAQGLPRFIFDPDADPDVVSSDAEITFEPEFDLRNGLALDDKTDDTTNQATIKDSVEYKQLLNQAITDPELRFPGWEEDAYHAGLLTDSQYEEMTKSNTSDDVLDHLDEAQLDELGERDEALIARMCRQEDVDGFEPEE